MKKFTLSLSIFALLFAFSANSFGQVLLEENFDYTIGSVLDSNGWKSHSGTANPILIGASTITLPGYASSGIGGEVAWAGSGYDYNKQFVEQITGDVYVAFIAQITATTTTGDYFLHLAPTTIGTAFKGRFYAKKDVSENLAFGIAHGATPVYTDFVYALNTTYLVVLKYSIVDGVANDVVSLFINPALNALEPAATVIAIDTPTDLANVGSIAIRQATAPAFILDGIRVVSTWADAVGSIPVGINEVSKNNSVSVYPNPSNGTFTVNTEKEISSISVFDITGKSVYANTNVISKEISLNVDAGVYFVEVKSGSEKMIQKITVK